MKKNLTFFVVLIVAGCANPYAKFYTDQTGGIFPENIEALAGNPSVFSGTDLQKDYDSMMENGYVVLGYSSFNGESTNKKMALAQAKKVNASRVLLYENYSGTVSGSMPLTLPETQMSTTNINGNVYGSGGYASYSGTGMTTTYGTKTTYIPYSVNRYDYFASYWGKVKKFRLGLYVEEMDASKRARIQSNKGVIVSAVVKGTPAFNADIFKGDVIKRIGDIEISGEPDFMAALDKFEGKKTNFLIYRDGYLIEKNVGILTKN